MCLKQKRYFHIFSFLQEETCSKTFDILHEKLMPSGREGTSNFYSCSMEKIKAVEEILVQNVVINFQLIFISFSSNKRINNR